MFKPSATKTDHPELSEFNEHQSMQAVLANKRGLSTSIAESLGALALGILVVTALALGLGAAYNYGQDSTAKASLDAVKSAQTLHQAKSGSFGDKDALTTGDDPALTKTSKSLAIVVGDRNYCAAVESGSMFKTKYWVTGKTGEIKQGPTKPTEAEAGVACPDPITQ